MRDFATLSIFLFLLTCEITHAGIITVAESGGDHSTIQAALNAAVPGDTVRVHEKATPYAEKVVFPSSGTGPTDYIVLEAAPGEAPIIDGTGVAGSNMILIDSKSYVKVIGFEIRNNLGVNDGSGVRVLGAGSHIEIRDNRIHDIRGSHAMGITIYGTESNPISDLVIDGNEIYDCEPAQSEALTLNGNVTSFEVTNNVVRDVNNIGIDFIGGETDIQPDPTKVARNGVCRGNQVHRANADYGGGFAGGIYVDGGKDIVIENNFVSECDLGIEIGAENSGIVTTGIVVRDNVVYANEKAGIVFGGFQASVGRVRNSLFLNNSLFKNDTLGEGLGELWIQYAEDNEVRNNIFYATSQNVMLYSGAGNVDNTLDYNLWYAEAGAAASTWEWNGVVHQGFGAYQGGTGQGAGSQFANPEYVDAANGDLHVAETSAAVNAGDPAFVAGIGEVDLDGGDRVNGPRVDVGADEVTTCGDGQIEVPEICDDGNLTDGDGCDSNCTPTGCGNGIVTSGEDCDDSNLDDGDCCSSTCVFEPAGSSCDDGDPCTDPDQCTVGACVGASEPVAGCVVAAKGALKLKDRNRDSLSWTWQRGTASGADFGDPAGGVTDYVLCVYDDDGGVSGVVLSEWIPGGGTCDGNPCWRESANDPGRFQYRDRDGDAGGVTKISLRPGNGNAKIKLKGKGAGLSLPGLPMTQDSEVTVQLKTTDGFCWGTQFAAPAKRNDAGQFKDTYRAED